jgi:general secretion pathway protein D
MRAVEKLVGNVQSMLRKQVYIEAQLIDVQLSDNFSFGVNWNLLRNRLAATFGTNPLTLASSTTTFPLGSNGLASTSLTIPAATIGSSIGAGLGVAFQGKNVSAVVNALEGFGNVQVLSNPNVQVRNGTPAIMAVGSSIRYVSSSSSTLVAPGGGASTSTSSVQTDSVFSGILVGVMPFMREDGRAELRSTPCRPTPTRAAWPWSRSMPTTRSRCRWSTTRASPPPSTSATATWCWSAA